VRRLFVVLAAAFALPTAALAQPEPARPAKRVSIVAMPIPVSNPAIGNGLAVAALAIYSPQHSEKPWVTGAGGLYADSKSWAAAVFQKAHLNSDKIRVTAGGGVGDFKLDFYGVGAGAGSRDRSIPIDQRGAAALAEVLFRVAPHTYGGVRYRGIRVRTSLDLSQLPFPDLEIPEVELKSQISALGLAGEYDTRDNEFGPRKGIYSTAQWLIASESLGSDFEYSKVETAANIYHALTERSAIAGRIALCDTGDGAPFYDLCMFGQNNDLRGYTAGQYRDHSLAAIQVEYRRDLFWRLGGVVFAGVGGVAPSFEKFGSTLLPAAGVGLRFRASQQHRVNASIDFAVGKDSQAFYFYIGEAF
jgi:outer membrane protein assembly factor BamA